MSKKKDSNIEVITPEVLGPDFDEVQVASTDDLDEGVIDISEKMDDEVMTTALMPIEVLERALVPVKGAPSKSDPLTTYLREISRYQLLSPEQEKALTTALFETGDIDIAKELVTANLRLVVKIAMEYKKAHQNVMDLIQEGNIGLMKAVSKYNPHKGAKLSYYASWWIRSYILKYILDNFRLIKVGTTNEQKKLFFNLMKEKERLMAQGIKPETKMIAENLGVSEKSVETMESRIGSHTGEVSMDTPVGDGKASGSSNMSLGDMLVSDDDEGIDDQLAHEQNLGILKENLSNFVDGLKERDRIIFEKRLLTEVPPSLQQIADEYGISRERVRQIEARLMKSLKNYMTDFLN